MAAAATLASATLEGQLGEIVQLIRAKQIDTEIANTNGISLITAYNTNDLTNRTTVTLSYEVEDVVDATDGSIDTAVKEVYA